MDHYGTFEALKNGWRMYMHATRGDGRTELLIRAVKSGDLIISIDRPRSEYLKKLARDADKDVTVTTMPAFAELSRVHHEVRRLNPKQSIYFDHHWLECWIATQLECIESSFAHMVEDLNERIGAEQIALKSRMPLAFKGDLV